ncbi:hypothetical protein D9757_008069 [Collybiopsis confluens]|uniref:DRMBL-domain-containing protein n=1 Tax=Collybiopsis confluens TaxID=2823264 RepID=A0A8H5H6Y8_9AGAR|nr:hypothetical protein D9757_008069 [Collybiopsis confluens]
MAVGQRKNKSQPTQSTTILSFFTPGPPPQKRRKASAHHLPSNPEIIVIDSDSEQEPDLNFVPLKKQRSSSPDIEFVEPESEPPVATSSRPYVLFGKPTSLLLNVAPPVAPLPPHDPSAVFGRPPVLLKYSSSLNAAGSSSSNTVMEAENDLFDVDEWGTGDDEISQITSEEDISEQEVHEMMLGSTVSVSSGTAPTPMPPPPMPVSETSTTCTSGLAASNAYSVLMASHKENQAWKEATVAEDRGFRPSKSNGGRRKAPFYKVLQGMPIAVDAFKYGTIPGVNAYFLTHAHSDHYTALSSSWNSGPIYCSEGTANLIVHMLKVDRSWVHALPMDASTEIPNTGGVHVSLIEANHCPGSCLFAFEGKQTVDAGDSAFKSPFVGSTRTFRYLHCGDFRASPAHVNHSAVKGKRIDVVYLDTTYLDPKYTFPPQPMVISACAELAKRIRGDDTSSDHPRLGTMSSWVSSSKFTSIKGKNKPENVLMVIGTYSIGKERIVKAVARALGSKIFCDTRKAAILRCQEDPELQALLTRNPLDAQVHIVPLGYVNLDKLKEYSEKYKGHFRKIVGLRPTGWTYSPPAGTDMTPSIPTIISRGQRSTFTHTDLHLGRGSSSTLQVYPVPYSEHSSFFELTCFAMSLEWGKMIATVNVGSESSRGKMTKWVESWEKERKKNGKGYIVSSRQDDYW